ncbi:MAG: Gfo/Idh/MocA family protein [Fibrobacterota bacterium]
MKICVIGSSGHYQNACSQASAREGVSITAAAPGHKDEKPANLSEYKSLPVPRTYSDYREMLDSEKPDAAIVNSRFDLNGKIAADILERGINVYCEKPVASSLEDLEILRKQIKKDGPLFCAMHELRYSPGMQSARAALRQKDLGGLIMITAQKSYRLNSRPEFYRNRATYSGTIPWVGSHAVDWIYWFSGKKFISGSAVHTNMYNNGHRDLEMSAHATMLMEGGIPAGMNLDYARPAGAPTHGDDRVRICCERGVIEVKDETASLINEEGIQSPLPIPKISGIFSDFLDKLTGKSPSDLPTPEDSLYITEICLKLRDSADNNGEKVSF